MILRNRNREDLQHGLKKLPTSCGLCLSPELLRSNNREPVTFQSRDSLFVLGEPDWDWPPNRSIHKEDSSHENHKEIQYLLADGRDDSGRGACHDGGGTKTGTLQGCDARE